jgi:hypothetical protein
LRSSLRIELVLDGHHASHGCHAIYHLLDFGLEHWPLQRDGPAARGDVNRARMRDEPPQPGTHSLDEHVIGRGFFLDEPIERTCCRATQTMANVAGRT